MKREPFWKSTKILWRYKRPLLFAFTAAAVSALCFGGGLAALSAVFDFFFNENFALTKPIDEHIRPHFPALAQWLINHLPSSVDHPGAPDRYFSFLIVLAFISLLTIIGSIGRYLHEVTTITVTRRAGMVWRNRLYKRIIHGNLIDLQKTGSSDHIVRMLSDTNLMANGYQAVVSRAVEEISKAAVAIVVAFIINWQFTLTALITVPVFAFVMRKFGKTIRNASGKALDEQGRLMQTVNETVSGAAVVKVYVAEAYERLRFRKINRAWYNEEMKARRAKSLSSPVTETIAYFGIMGIAVVSAYPIMRNHVPAADFLTVMASLGIAARGLKPITTLHITIKEADAAAARVFEALNMPNEATWEERRKRSVVLARHHEQIRFESLSYTYPGQTHPAVDDVTLDVKHGSTVAIVGMNGSGKTTLLSLVSNLIMPSSGKILIDGQDIAHASLRSLRGQMAVVTQHSILFHGTIAENIAYAQNTPREKIIAAAKSAYADEFIQQQPDGYDTMLGEDGSGLSGGQRQRICIARAILRDPAILILDEATSMIDADSEAKINAALRSLRAGRTVFVIAHRLSTVIDADMIVVMNAGKIVDMGKHAELLTRCPAYKSLTLAQLQAA